MRKQRPAQPALLHFDPIGRQIASADYGTNGGDILVRLDLIPAGADDILVTSSEHNAAGYVEWSTNPKGIVTRIERDDRGRETARIMNYLAVSESSSSSSSSESSEVDCALSKDKSVAVEMSYTADGQLAAITAQNSETEAQTTTYVYGTTLDDSEIATSTLRRAEIYPDSSNNQSSSSSSDSGPEGDDRITFAYNRQSQRIELRDQNGTVHVFDFDKLGRETHDRVTVLGPGVDGAVRRISTTFEVRGMR